MFCFVFSLRFTKIFMYLAVLIPYYIAGHSIRAVFASSDAGIVGSNPTLGMDVWSVYVFCLCLCCPVFGKRPCDGLITRPRSPTVCEKWLRNWIRGQGPVWAGRAIEKEKEKDTVLQWPPAVREIPWYGTGLVPRVRYVLADCHLKFICPAIGDVRTVNRS
jgi:hypothetical protein